MTATKGVFARPHWHIEHFDKTTSKTKKLAGNEPPSEKEE
jgi:hypothetical protein